MTRATGVASFTTSPPAGLLLEHDPRGLCLGFLLGDRTEDEILGGEGRVRLVEGSAR